MVAALVAGLDRGRTPKEARELDFSPWAGAYNRVPAQATAFPHRGERFLLKQSATVHPGVSTPERNAARSWLTGSWALTYTWGSGGAYPNFPDPDLPDSPTAYYGANLDRLRRVRRAYDPDGRLRLPRSM